MPEVSRTTASPAAPLASPSAVPVAPTHAQSGTHAVSASVAAPAVSPSVAAAAASPESAQLREVRRSELRARFEALEDRLLAVEDGIDTLLRRSAHRDKLERRSDQQSVEMIDTVAQAGERQATVLEGLLSSVSRLEQALIRLEHGLARIERGGVSERGRRDSVFPTASAHVMRSSASQFPDALAPRERERYSSTRNTDQDELLGSENAGINGHLSEMSLSTVLAMLEIERHSGRLKVATDDGMLASFELSEGSVISSRYLENDADPLQTLRSALCWKQGRFWFKPQPAEPPSFAPRSIGSLLLEATRQNDESFADVG